MIMHHLFLKRELDPRQQEDHQEQEQRLDTGGFESAVDDGVFVNVVNQCFRLVCGAACSQQLDLGEALEGAGDVQEQNEEHLGRSDGKNDVEDPAEGAGAVQVSTLQQILRHIPEANQQEDEADTDVHPDGHNHHRPGGIGHCGGPADFTQAQKLIQQTVLLAVDKQEDSCRGRRGDGHGQSVHGLVELGELHLIGGHQGEDTGDAEGEHQVQRCHSQGNAYDIPEAVLAQNTGPVCKANPFGHIAQLIGQGERKENGFQEGVIRKGSKEEQCRKDQQIGQRFCAVEPLGLGLPLRQEFQLCHFPFIKY